MKVGKHLILIAIAILFFFQGQAFSYQENDRYVRVRYVEGDVTVRPSDNQRSEAATINTPILDGDMIETGDGRAELTFHNGVVVRVTDNSAIRINSSYSPMTVELLQGSLFVDSYLVDSLRDELQVQAGEAQVYLIEEGVMRVDLGREGGVRVTSVRGEAEVAANGKRVLLESGERTYVDPGQYPEPPSANYGQADELDDWNQSRMDLYSRRDYYDQGDSYVDKSIYYDTYDLGYYGDWTSYGSYGRVWVPHVSYGWRPYFDGRWSYCNNSWFWVSYEPWGWAPYHYGRWGWAIDIGWYWIPGNVFAPAWVSWYDYGDYIGWCPLNYYNRPIIGYNYHNAYNYPIVQKQKTIDVPNSWTFVKKQEIGAVNVKRVSAAPNEVQKIRIDERKIMRSPQSQLTSYVMPKTISTKPDSYLRGPARESDSDSRNPVATVHRYEQFRREQTVSPKSVISPGANQQHGGTSVRQQPAPERFNRDWDKERTESTRPKSIPYYGVQKRAPDSGQSGQSYDRDSQFYRQNERTERHYGSYVSPYYREKDRNTDRGFGETPWFRDPDSYQPYNRKSDPGEVRPRYSDEARKIFERFDRGTQFRPESEPKGQPHFSAPESRKEFRPVEPRRIEVPRPSANPEKGRSSGNQKPPKHN